MVWPHLEAARPKRGLPRRRLKYSKVLSKLQEVILELGFTGCRTYSIESYFGAFRIEIEDIT